MILTHPPQAANVPTTGTKAQLVAFLLDPVNNQKGKRKVKRPTSGHHPTIPWLHAHNPTTPPP